MKTQKFLVEVTDITGQFPVAVSDMEDVLMDGMPSYGINVVEQ